MRRFMFLLLALTWLSYGQSGPADAHEAAGANLPIQRIGMNDLLAVSVYDTPELSRSARVDSEGYIRLPMLKRRVKAQGSMPVEVEAAIAEALREEQLIVDPFVTVTVAEYASRPISVVGAVKRPLTFQADAPVTLLEALARAEGLTPEAGGEILVSRQASGSGQNALTRRIPVQTLIAGADSRLNILLEGGEEVRVPEAGRIYVVGNVKKPGAFPLLDGSGMSLLKALAQSEGLTPYAARQAFIYRQEAAGFNNQITVELKQVLQRKAPDVPLLANDILYIPDNSGKRLSMATLEKILLLGGAASTALIYALVR
ncbi:MAG: polysaccharide biosynthesis/export family protein [Bryobacteraceae bacterium]